MKPLIKYPWFDEDTGFQLFPFKTMIVIITFIVIPLVSLCAERLFRKGILSERLDIFQAFGEKETESSLSVTADVVRLEIIPNKYEKPDDTLTTLKTSQELRPMIS